MQSAELKQRVRDPEVCGSRYKTVCGEYRGPVWSAILKVDARSFVKHILGHRLGSVMTIKGGK